MVMSDKKTETETNTLIRAKAAQYARLFLAQKYYEEYSELYYAYCKNRGLTTRRNGKPIPDERELVSE
jgi:hypothetical protein